MTQTDELWVFAYGSLVWDPGIAVAESCRAKLRDFRRGFCMWSIHHRGTETDPGLVLALEPHPGAQCTGLALRAAEPEAALAELRERELISSAYEERRLIVHNDAGGAIDVLAYVINTDHVQYCPELTAAQQAEIIAGAHGGRGPNHEYLTNTVEGLRKIGIEDPELDDLVARVQQIRAVRSA